MSERTFSAEIYQLQVADYKELCNPIIVPRGKRKPIVRAKRPPKLYSSSNRYKEMSTKCDSISDAQTLIPSLKVSAEVVTIHEIYNYFDEELGVKRVLRDPFSELIDRARKAILNPKLAKPKLQWWTWFNDFLVDDNETKYEAHNFFAYKQMREKNPDYKPKITTEIKRNKFTEVLKIHQVDDEAIEDWIRTSDYNNWDYIVEHYYSLLDQMGSLAKEMGISEGEKPEWYHIYMPDIYEMGVNSGKEYFENYGRDSAIAMYFFAFDGDQDEMYNLYEVVDPDIKLGQQRPEAQLIRNLTNHFNAASKEPENPLPRDLQQVKELEEQANLTAQDAIETPRPRIRPNHSGAPTILECVFGDEANGIPAYLNAPKWRTNRAKTKTDYTNILKKCTDIIGDVPIDQLTPLHGLDIAKHLDSRTNSNDKQTSQATIATYIGNMRSLCKFISQNIINPNTNASWLTYGNPFSDIDIQGYGAKKRPWEALEVDQLNSLFATQMPDSHRLIFEILLKTGMRLDEVILLEWEQLKKGSKEDEEHIRYFDLSDSLIKNDAFSRRNVVLPDSLKLPDRGTGIIFPEWQKYLNADGKGSKEASRQLMEKYIKPIRYSKEDDRKVVHSLRHNLIGLMENLNNPPAPEHHMDWITGHGMEGNRPDSERKRSYGSDPSLINKYVIVNRIQHPWCEVKQKENYRWH